MDEINHPIEFSTIRLVLFSALIEQTRGRMTHSVTRFTKSSIIRAIRIEIEGGGSIHFSPGDEVNRFARELPADSKQTRDKIPGRTEQLGRRERHGADSRMHSNGFSYICFGPLYVVLVVSLQCVV